MYYSELTREMLTPEQEATLKAVEHFMALAKDHERKKVDYNDKANLFLLRIKESSDAITLKNLSDLLGISPTAVDKRLRRARGV